MLLFSPEQKLQPNVSTERIRQSFEYKDVDGRKICDVELVLGPKEPIPTGDPSHGRKIESYILHYEKSDKKGKKEKLDLLKFAQRHLTVSTPTYLVEESGYALHSEFKHVVVLSESYLKSALGPATLLHEYGHAEQEQDPRFADAIAASSLAKIAELSYDEISLNTVEKIRSLLSEEQGNQLMKTLGQLREFEGEKYLLQSRIELRTKELESLRASGNMDARKLDTIKMLEKTVVESAARLMHVEEQRKSLFAELDPLLYLPVQILERNATARALLSLRELRDVHNLNLLVSVRRNLADISFVEKEWLKKKKGIDCQTIVAGVYDKILSTLFGKMLPNEVASTAEERLIKYALSTYKATTPELGKKYGYIPSPRHTPLKSFEESRVVDDVAVIKAVPTPETDLQSTTDSLVSTPRKKPLPFKGGSQRVQSSSPSA